LHTSEAPLTEISAKTPTELKRVGLGISHSAFAQEQISRKDPPWLI